MRAKWHMSDTKKTFPCFSYYKLKLTSSKKNGLAKSKNWVILYDLYNYMIYIIINPLHTSDFSLTVIINHLF